MKFKVTGQRLEIEAPMTVSEGARNFVTFELTSDESWKDFIKTARFENENTEYVCDVPDVEEGKAYYIPSEILVGGRVSVGVVGVCGQDRLATTQVAHFDVEKAIDNGKMPTITPNAYAKYVNDVREHRRVSERASESCQESLDECRRLSTKVSEIFESNSVSERKVRRMLEESSGILDAVGVAFREIVEIKESLSLLDTSLVQAEKKRDTMERAREISENKRKANETLRQKSEVERASSEIRRSREEGLRIVGEVERQKKFNELDKRILELENKKPELISSVVGRLTNKGRVELLDSAALEVIGITVYGESYLENGKLCGVGENGSVTLNIQGEAVSVSLPSPLYSVGDIRDELVISADGSVNVIRRIEKYIVNSKSPLLRDDSKNERVMFVAPLETNGARCDSDGGMSSYFSYGAGCDEDSVWVSGEYLFFNLDSNKYPDTNALTARLESDELVILYPKDSAEKEEEGSVVLPDLSVPCTIDGEYTLSLEYKKDIFKTFEKIISRLDSLEEKEEYNGNNEEACIT